MRVRIYDHEIGAGAVTGQGSVSSRLITVVRARDAPVLERIAEQQSTMGASVCTGPGRIQAEWESERDALNAISALLDPADHDAASLSIGAHAPVLGEHPSSGQRKALELARSVPPGQVVVSRQFAAMVAPTLPAGLRLVAAGEHPIGDLAQPETLFLLTHEGSDVEGGPLRTVRTVPNNLARPATPFIGRDDQLARADELLEESRFLTLTGPPGAGKSRLALRLVGGWLGVLADGARFVDLAPFASGSDATAAIVAALPWLQSGEATSANLSQALVSRSLVLLLDNCERVADDLVGPLTEVLRACHGVRVVATSRRPFDAADETTFPLGAMAVPPLGSSDPERIAAYESAALLSAMARLVRPGFSIDEDNAGGVAELCRMLDGLPLRILLAAPRLRSMSAREVVDRLGVEGVVGDGDRHETATVRHVDVDAMLGWSYELLEVDERRAYAVASVFPGGFDLGAAESVLGAEAPADRSPALFLESLARHSLIEVAEIDGHSTYRMLETIRDHAGRRLAELGGADAARDRHLAWYVQVAETHGPAVGGPGDAAARRVLGAQLANLEAALRWALDTGQHERAGRLALALGRFWQRTGLWAAGRRWLQPLVDPERTLPTPPDTTTARLRLLAGTLAREQGQYAEAEALLERARAQFEALGDATGMARAGVEIAASAVLRFDPSAQLLLDEALAASKAANDRASAAVALDNLGFWALLHDRTEEASARYSEALQLFRELGDTMRIGRGLARVGQVAYLAGRHARALGLYEEAVAIFRTVGDQPGLADALVGLANSVFLAPAQDLERARDLCEEAATIQRELDDERNLAWTLYVLAEITRDLRDRDASRRAADECLALAERLGIGPLDTLPLFSQAELRYVELDFEGSAPLCRIALDHARQFGLGLHILRCLEASARLAASRGQFPAAARLLGYVAASRRDFWPEERAAVRALHTEASRAVEAALGAGPFQEALEDGQAMSVDQAAALAATTLAAPPGWPGGAAGDRADGTQPASAEVTHRLVELLGRFRVVIGADEVDIPGIPGQVVKLVATRRRIPVDELVEALWPEAPPGAGRGRLRNILTRIRARAGELVVREDEMLVLAADVATDVTAFEQRTAVARALSREGSRELAVAHATEALGLYRGELLPADRHLEWTVELRERLVREYLELLDLLMVAALDAGDVGRAAALLDEAIALEPYDETLYVRGAQLLVDHGWPSRAARYVQKAEQMLVELEVPPSAALATLRRELRQTP